MDVPQKPIFNKILIAVDGSAASISGVYEAVKLATIDATSLRLLHMIDGLDCKETFEAGTVGQIFTETKQEEGRSILREASKVLAVFGLTADCHLLDSHEGRIAARIIREATEWSADIIVMGTHGRRGIARLALGSAAEEAARESPVPVLLVRAAY